MVHTMTNTQNTYGYVDSAYLSVTTEQLHHFKTLTYEKMHLQPGHQILDLGCGPASDTIALAGLVGKSGRVVGVDHDPDMITAANQKAAAAGVSSNVTHELHDAVRLPYADNTFDSCRSERVFQHLPEPAQALAELVRVTKPGGWVVLMDADWGSMSYHSTLPAIEWKVKMAYAETCALHPTIGRELHHLMEQARLISITAIPMPLVFYDFPNANYVAVLESRIKPRGLEGGYFTVDEFDRFNHDLRQLDAQGNFFAYICGIVAAGQKPD